MAKTCTYIDGIGTSQAIDTSGEVVDLKGHDISSLPGAVFNWEHQKDVPAQIVGKIIEATKIFSKEDCKNERHLYYWNKVQMPFLYIMGRLFDDRKPSAMEVAALFQDDADHPHEQPILGFSIEGARLGEKQGMLVPRSIGRKVTITNVPANKTCVAQILPEKKPADKNGFESLFKGELEIFKFEPSYSQILEKKEKDLEKDAGMSIGASGVGGSGGGSAGGGAFIGSQLAMSEEHDYGMEKSDIHSKGWSKPQTSHSKQLGTTVSHSHPKFGHVSMSKHPSGHFEVKHNAKVVSTHKTPGEAGGAARSYMMARSEDLTKAMTAGSFNAAPGQLEGGAALSRESLESRSKKVNSLKKKEKSHWYEQASQAYDTWDKKNHFKDYMKKRMPHLAEGEVDAIGKCLALKKARAAESKLSKMYASYFNKSRKVEKGSDVMMASENKKKE